MRAVGVLVVRPGTLLSAGAGAQDGLSPADRALARDIFKQLIEINTTDSLGNTPRAARADRKSTRLNSSHLVISYAVFCLKKKNNLESCTTTCQAHTSS